MVGEEGEQAVTEIKYTYEPLQFYGRAHYDADGEVTRVDVSVNGNAPVIRYPDPGDGIGDLFEEAFEAAKNRMLTAHVVGLVTDAEATERT